MTATEAGPATGGAAPLCVAFEVAALCCAAASPVVEMNGLRVVVGARVVPLMIVAAVVSAAVLAGQWVRSPRSGGRDLRVATSCLVLSVTLLAGALEALQGTSYTVVPGTSEHGCRALVGERSFLAQGAGEIYLLRGSSGIAREAAAYSTDEPEGPFTDGSARVRWHGDHATVTGDLTVYSRSGSETLSC